MTIKLSEVAGDTQTGLVISSALVDLGTTNTATWSLVNAKSRGITRSHTESRGMTPNHAKSHGITRNHTESRGITRITRNYAESH